jgi:hypothetical protein
MTEMAAPVISPGTFSVSVSVQIMYEIRCYTIQCCQFRLDPGANPARNVAKYHLLRRRFIMRIRVVLNVLLVLALLLAATPVIAASAAAGLPA